MCFWLFHAQSFHEPAVLLRGKLTGFFAIARPLMLSIFKPLIQQNEAVSLLVQRLDPVPLSSAKQKRASEHGSSLNYCCTSMARPSIPLRISVYPQAIYTCAAPVKSFSMTKARETAQTVLLHLLRHISAQKRRRSQAKL